MPSILTNLASLTAQRNLGATQMGFQKSVTRLSSGLRINSAADDAAGLYLSKKVEAQVRGLQQATRNAQDGVGMVQVAEGALNATHSMLLRLRELAVQSANGVLSNTDRAALVPEANSLLDEITRISSSTKFNGLTLLNGTMGGAQVTLGDNVALVNSSAGVVKQARTGTTVAGVSVNGGNLTAANGVDNVQARSAGADPVAYDLTVVYTAATDSATLTLTKTWGAAPLTDTATVTNVSQSGSKIASFANFEIDVTVNSALTAGAATITAGNNRFTVSRNLALIDVDTVSAGIQTGGSTLAQGQQGLTLQVGANNTASDQFALENFNSMSAEALSLVKRTGQTGSTYSIAENLKTQTGAQAAMDILDSALNQVSQQRSRLGALQNRLDYTVSTIGIATENMQAANSRIVDADVAVEVSNMVKMQILSQSGMAVLAQANGSAQSILTLFS